MLTQAGPIEHNDNAALQYNLFSVQLTELILIH